MRLKNGRWRGQLCLRKPNGKRTYKIVERKTRREVQEALTAALRTVHQTTNVVPEKKTVAEFLRTWIADVVTPNHAPKTVRTFSDIVRLHLEPGLGHVQLTKLNAQHIRRFLNDKSASNLSAKTVKHLRDTLRNALNVAEKDGLILRNPATHVDAPRIEEKEPRIFASEEARIFLDAIRGHRWEALFAVAISLGLRQGEALGLRWEDVDFEKRILRVRQALSCIGGVFYRGEPKTARSRRTLPLPQVSLSALLRHQARQTDERLAAGDAWVDNGLVFTTSVGTPINARNLLREFKTVLAGAGLPTIRFHDLRHSAASLLAEQGVHPRTMMEILGHSDIKVTMEIYAHVMPSTMRDAAAVMDRVLTPPLPREDCGDEESNVNRGIANRVPGRDHVC